MQSFLAVFVMHGRDEHTTGIDTHHRARREVRDSDARFSDQFLRLVVIVNAGKDHSVRPRTVIQHEFQEFFGLFDRFAGLDLDGAEVGFRERLKIDKVLEQRLDLDVGEVDRLVLDLDLDRARRTTDDANFLWLFCLGSVQRLHCGE